jgi:hypothetical protein
MRDDGFMHDTDKWRREHDLPTRAEENAIPEGLSELGRKAAEAIVAHATKVLGHHPDTGGCTTFYTPQHWTERGEEYGCGDELIIVYDGGDMAPFFNLDYMAYDLYEGMREAVEKACDNKAYIEACTGWYSALVKG